MIDLFLNGVDGSRWDLIRGPVRVTSDGLTGLLPGPTERRVTSNAMVNGQQRTGGRALPRTVLLPVIVFTDGTAEDFWRLYGAWSSALSDAADAELVAVNTVTGLVCTLPVAVEQWPVDMPQDPSTSRRLRLTYQMVADGAFWRLPTVTIPFESAAAGQVDFYLDAVDGDDQFMLSTDSQSGRARVMNPGTEPVAWMARFSAPSSGFRVSIDGHVVSGTYAVPDGSVLELDSGRGSFYLLRNGVRQLLPFHLFDRFDFAPLRAGEASEVSVENEGTGMASLTFDPLRREAL